MRQRSVPPSALFRMLAGLLAGDGSQIGCFARVPGLAQARGLLVTSLNNSVLLLQPWLREKNCD